MLSGLFAAGGARANAWDARLTESEGSVTVYPQGREDGVAAEEGMPLESGDRIVTGAESRAELALDAQSIVELGPRSTFTLESLDEGAAGFFLKLGSLSAKLRSLLAGRSLRVRTPTAVAAVRGTEFAVEAEEEQTHVGVFDEGRVSVFGADGSGEIEISSNQETQVLRGRAPARAMALRRLLRLRARMERLRARREVLRLKWKTLPREQRLRLRRALWERRRANLRRPWQERRKAAAQQRPSGTGPFLRERIQERREERRRRGKHPQEAPGRGENP